VISTNEHAIAAECAAPSRIEPAHANSGSSNRAKAGLADPAQAERRERDPELAREM
jgi:hypothetical protein